MNLGLIGCGKMGKAFLRGALESGILTPQSTYICSRSPHSADDLKAQFGIQEVRSILELIDHVKVILIAVKPKDLPEVLRTLSMGGLQNHLIISLVAGITMDQIKTMTYDHARIARVMPNTPTMIGIGAAGFCLSDNTTPTDSHFVYTLVNAVGLAYAIPESLMDIVTGISGSGPAYMFTIIEAMADAGVLHGLPRDQAIKLAAQTMKGAAAMVLETNIHPAVLRDQVTSPGGTTIAALATLEKNKLRSTMIEGVTAATLKSKAIAQSTKVD